MSGAIPPLLADAGAAAGALAAIIGFLALSIGLIVRAARRAERAFHDRTIEIIDTRIPVAMEKASPEATRAVVREEVDRAIEPHVAQLRDELRQVVAEMKPNGGSSMLDRLTARMDSIEAGQRKIFAHLDTVGSLADADDPNDTAGET